MFTVFNFADLQDIKYEIIASLETHVQVNSLSKAFCSCPNIYGSLPNLRVCPTCLGLPGSLPQLNKRLCEVAILLGTVFRSEISEELFFVRKNYSYPDLPKGYQITQVPSFCQGGYLDIMVEENPKRVELEGLHMEEDSGKILYLDDDRDTAYVDYNRAGSPLIEIVSKPCLSSAEEVSVYAQTLRDLVRHLGVSDGDMEEGSLRCDVNVNVKINDNGEIFKTSVIEVKNLNSFKALRKAVDYEVRYQLSQWVTAKKESKSNTRDVIQKKIAKDYWETKSWDEKRGQTVYMRSKGIESDYRFFIEPDIPRCVVPKEWVQNIAKEVGELPLQIRLKLKEKYGLNDKDSIIITQSNDFMKFYEKSACSTKEYKKLANWLLNDLVAVLKIKGVGIEKSPISEDSLAQLVNCIQSGDITGKQAKDIFQQMVETQKMPKDLIQSAGIIQISDENILKKIILEVLEENQNTIADYKQGKTHALQFLMGMVMKKSAGKVNPELARKVLDQELGRLV